MNLLHRFLHRVSVVIAKGKRPVTFRTRKLSPSAPMVLPRGRGGRVGRRRTYFTNSHPGCGVAIRISRAWRVGAPRVRGAACSSAPFRCRLARACPLGGSLSPCGCHRRLGAGAIGASRQLRPDAAVFGADASERRTGGGRIRRRCGREADGVGPTGVGPVGPGLRCGGPSWPALGRGRGRTGAGTCPSR